MIDEDTIWLAAYPRSGTTWIRYVLTSLFIPGYHITRKEVRHYTPNAREEVPKNHAVPLIIKTHEWYKVDKGYDNVIYLVRDGRDSLCSYYDMHCRHYNFDKGFARFFSLYMQNQLPHGRWGDHVQVWNHANYKRHLFIKYEDIYRDTLKLFKSIAEFCGLLFTQEELQEAIAIATYDKLAHDLDRERVGLRKGLGAWREFFTEQQHELFLQAEGRVLKQMGYIE